MWNAKYQLTCFVIIGIRLFCCKLQPTPGVIIISQRLNNYSIDNSIAACRYFLNFLQNFYLHVRRLCELRLWCLKVIFLWKQFCILFKVQIIFFRECKLQKCTVLSMTYYMILFSTILYSVGPFIMGFSNFFTSDNR